MEENSVEQETPETEIIENAADHFTDTVSGNDTGPEPAAPQTEENGQGELLERLDALVDVLTPGEEETEESGIWRFCPVSLNQPRLNYWKRFMRKQPPAVRQTACIMKHGLSGSPKNRKTKRFLEKWMLIQWLYC